MWRVCNSLLVLRDEINARFPGRSKLSDGTIGDSVHVGQGTDSDHNPWYTLPGAPAVGIVRALDVTHDPARGCDIGGLSDELQANKDPRISYVIANGLIMSGNGGPAPWQWRPYGGSDPHRGHMHVSVVAAPACDDGRPWILNGGNEMTDAQFKAIMDALTTVVRNVDKILTMNNVPDNALGWHIRNVETQIAALAKPAAPVAGSCWMADHVK